ncbi:MAG: adenylosuccinate synthetase [Deltaproteobacteria bacterium]|nr:adenylosuccinate synthetase [Deltaproteobacteria bacterium]
MTLLDVLGYLGDIPICTAYEIGGKTRRDFPTPAFLDQARPILEVHEGWKCDITSVRSFSDLPSKARKYVLRIEELVGVPVGWISVGPHREAIFRR